VTGEVDTEVAAVVGAELANTDALEDDAEAEGKNVSIEGRLA
jgi:hypothetical protein